MTHGRTATKFAKPDDSAKIQVRYEQWCDELRPESPYQEWLARQVVAASVRADRCRLDEDAWRYRQARRAEGAWDVDRRAEVEKLAEGLGRRPARVAGQLRQSTHGCDWLLSHWKVLGEVLRAGAGPGTGNSPRPLSDDARQLACDLLGLTPESRLGLTPLDLPPGSDEDADLAAHQGRVIDGQIAELLRHKIEVLAELDAVDQASAMGGLGPGVDPTLRLIRRYETAALRERRRAMDELRRLQREARSTEPCRSEPSPANEPTDEPCELESPIEPAASEPDPPPDADPAVLDAAPEPVVQPRPAAMPTAVAIPPSLPARPHTLSEMDPPRSKPLNRRQRLAEARKAARRS